MTISIADWITDWMPKIRSKLNIVNDDVDTILKYEHLGKKNQPLEQIQLKRKVICVGAADLIDQQLDELLNKVSIDELQAKYSVLAADGVVEKLLKRDIIPNVVLTDLDGGLEILAPLTHKTTFIVLIHGDNHDLLDQFLKMDIKHENIFWTTQGLPIFGFHNFTGFTDGDRAVCLATQFRANSLLLGYDFSSGKIGDASIRAKTQTDEYLEKKEIKLAIAQEIIIHLSKRHAIYTVDVNVCPGRSSSIQEFLVL